VAIDPPAISEEIASNPRVNALNMMPPPIQFNACRSFHRRGYTFLSTCFSGGNHHHICFEDSDRKKNTIIPAGVQMIYADKKGILGGNHVISHLRVGMPSNPEIYY